ncbi:GNAT family N-acetyltransferase [Viridibacterium curvum]|uniref:GNAT family N-acetyltransferase n=1 Tax=Viridibacterium curvum TaxID=1101404 RepID=A0ABP9QCJ0_9RHOO
MSLSLRPATTADAEALLRWRNDPQTRAASHTPDLVPAEQHMSWFATVLADPQRRLWIAELADGQTVGSIRADWTGGEYLLSWMLAPEARGKGLGTSLLQAAVKMLPGQIMRAEIKDENVASWRMAEAAGFLCVKNEDGVRHYLR